MLSCGVFTIILFSIIYISNGDELIVEDIVLDINKTQKNNISELQHLPDLSNVLNCRYCVICFKRINNIQQISFCKNKCAVYHSSCYRNWLSVLEISNKNNNRQNNISSDKGASRALCPHCNNQEYQVGNVARNHDIFNITTTPNNIRTDILVCLLIVILIAVTAVVSNHIIDY
eukprot:245954_1